MKKWFDCVVKSGRSQEDGSVKVCLTNVLLEAWSYSDAEAILNALLEGNEVESVGEFEIKKIAKSNITDVPFHYNGSVGLRAKEEAEARGILITTLSEEDDFDISPNWKVKTKAETILINAEDMASALEKVGYLYYGDMGETDVVAASLTKIENVFRHVG